jgi:hypothetical protein
LFRERFTVLWGFLSACRSKTVGNPVTRLPSSYMPERRADDTRRFGRAFWLRPLSTLEPAIF